MPDPCCGLYGHIASTLAKDIGKWSTGTGAVKTLERNSCHETVPCLEGVSNAQLHEWKRSFRLPILMEVGHTLGTTLELEDRTVYKGFLVQDEELKWVFDHLGHMRGRLDMGGMVAEIAVKNGPFKWLCVFQSLSTVTLNEDMIPLKSHFLSHPLGVKPLEVTVRLLTSVQSSIRQYAACEQEAEISFAKELYGEEERVPSAEGSMDASTPRDVEQVEDSVVTVPTAILASTPPRAELFSKNREKLNEDQIDVVSSWVGTPLIDPPRFSLFQGPPGTGKTTTAVEILRESLDPTRRVKKKYVCSGPSWTSVYVFLGRFAGEHKGHCDAEGLRIAMSGCADETRIAAIEPPEIQEFSVVTLLRTIDTWCNSTDRSEQGYDSIMESIASRAPSFHEELLSQIQGKSLDERGHKLSHIFSTLRSALISEAHVVFATLNSLASSYISAALSDSAVGMLIVDEAGQASDPDLFIGCNLEPDRLLLIGDQQQLPPFALSKAAEQWGFKRSSLERLYPQHQRMLTVQYRMPEAVLAFPNGVFYDEKLKTADVLKKQFKGSDVYCVYDVAHGRQGRVGTSLNNPSEAACAVQCIRDIRVEYPIDNILVISPYSGQCRLMRKYLSVYLPGDPNVRVSTIDGCQGAECEHVILSLVRTDGKKKADCHATEPKHVCVALTRAQKSMAVLCNASEMQRKSGLMASLIADAKERDCIRHLPEPGVAKGRVVGKNVIFKRGSVLPTDLSALGWKVLCGDEVTVRCSVADDMLLEDVVTEEVVVVDVTVDEGSELRSKAFPCLLVNDRNVCFKVYHSERRALINALQLLAKKSDKNTCNSADVTACERQPNDDRYFTVTMGDALFAEQIMNGDITVSITLGGTTREVVPDVTREHYHHKFAPLDNRVPVVHVRVTPGSPPNHRNAYMVRLIDEDAAETWKGEIVSTWRLQGSERILHGMLRAPEELVQLVLTGVCLQQEDVNNNTPKKIRRLIQKKEACKILCEQCQQALRIEFRVGMNEDAEQLCKTSTGTGALLQLAEQLVSASVLSEALGSLADLPRQDYEDAAILLCVHREWYNLEKAADVRRAPLTLDEVVDALRAVVPFLPSFGGRRCQKLRSQKEESSCTEQEDSCTQQPSDPAALSPCVVTIDAKDTKVFDDALSVRSKDGAFEVSLFVANPKPALDRVGDSSARTALRAHLRTRAADTHMLGYIRRLMPQWVLDDASLKADDGVKDVLQVTFHVDKDGIVNEVAMSGAEIQIAANLVADSETTWADLKQSTQCTGQQAVQEQLALLQKAALAMMHHERYLEEAANTQALGGPAHVVQYLVVRAKRAAAARLSEKVPEHLFTNTVGSLEKVRAVLQEGGCEIQPTDTETALCHALQGKHDPALVRRVCDLTAPSSDRTYHPGVSTVSFTSPLRRFVDYVVLQALLKDTATPGKLLAQHTLELRTQYLREYEKEYAKTTAAHKTISQSPRFAGNVTHITTDGTVGVHIPETGAMLSSTLERLGDATSVGDQVPVKLILACPRAYGRYRPAYIIPFAPHMDDEAEAETNRRTTTYSAPRFAMRACFAFKPQVMKEYPWVEINTAVFTALGTDDKQIRDCVKVQENACHLGPGHVLKPKSALCTRTRRREREDTCGVEYCPRAHLFESTESLREFFISKRHVLVAAACKVSSDLQCSVRVSYGVRKG